MPTFLHFAKKYANKCIVIYILKYYVILVWYEQVLLVAHCNSSCPQVGLDLPGNQSSSELGCNPKIKSMQSCNPKGNYAPILCPNKLFGANWPFSPCPRDCRMKHMYSVCCCCAVDVILTCDVYLCDLQVHASQVNRVGSLQKKASQGMWLG
jgi:hypothetical protein